jgi:hypothetical protein
MYKKLHTPLIAESIKEKIIIFAQKKKKLKEFLREEKQLLGMSLLRYFFLNDGVYVDFGDAPSGCVGDVFDDEGVNVAVVVDNGVNGRLPLMMLLLLLILLTLFK